MKIEQKRWTEADGWKLESHERLSEPAQLVLVFGGTSRLKDQKFINDIRGFYPVAHILGCSTAGEICDINVSDDSLITTAVKFDYSQIKDAEIKINDDVNSFQAGERLSQSLDKEGLVHVLSIMEKLLRTKTILCFVLCMLGVGFYGCFRRHQSTGLDSVLVWTVLHHASRRTGRRGNQG